MVVRPGPVVLQLLRLSPCQSHGITHSGKLLTRAGEKVPDHYRFTVAVSLLVILLTSVVCCFGKKMLTSNNVLLRILARLYQLKTVALAAKYGIFQLGSCSVRNVKCGILALSGTLCYDL